MEALRALAGLQQPASAPPAAPPGQSMLGNAQRIAADALMSYGAQTGKYLDHAFNNLPLPVLTGREIQQHYEGRMSPQGQNLYNNNVVYQEATDPANYVLGAAGKAGKALGFVASPIAELATGAGKAYGRIMDANRSARFAAKRSFRP